MNSPTQVRPEFLRYTYKAVRKRTEHGGGWAFMRLDELGKPRIVCACGEKSNAWIVRLHPTQREAWECFYDHEIAKPIRVSWLPDDGTLCKLCQERTDQLIVIGNLMFMEAICPACAPITDHKAVRVAMKKAFPLGRKAGVIRTSW